jgi:Raf kinase inhibitor-like YbhB/YbcL family protein
VLVIDDPDAPGGTFTHLVAWNLSPELRTIKEGVDVSTLGATVGTNDGKSLGYKGPCPPQGEEHRYEFHVMAVDQPLALREGSTRADVDTAMVGHLLGEGTLTAQFGH